MIVQYCGLFALYTIRFFYNRLLIFRHCVSQLFIMNGAEILNIIDEFPGEVTAATMEIIMGDD